MGKKKQSIDQIIDEVVEEVVEETFAPHPQLADGTYFSFIRLSRDNKGGRIPCERIVQMVVREGVPKTFVSESLYFSTEAFGIFNRLVRFGYDNGIMKRKNTLVPSKDKIFWRELTPEFVAGQPGPRINPETGEPK